MDFDLHQLDQVVLVGAAVTLVAVLAAQVSSRVGLPSLLVYLVLGVLLGESVLGIGFENADVAHALGFAALALILAEGGLTTDWSAVRPSLRVGALLATVGVGVSVAVVAGLAHLILGMPWTLAVLLGAVTAPTDAAAVFSVLRLVPLRKALVGALEAESGLNDAPTVVLVTLVSAGAVADHPPVVLAGIMAGELVGGVLLGVLVGRVGAWVLRRAALPASGLYPIAVLTLALVAYALGATLHLSGFAAVYVAALVLGQADLPHRGPTRSFAEGVAWLAQIGLFVMLGLLLSPGRITLATVLVALAVTGIATFVARPLAVAVSTLGSGLGVREQLFLSWAGLRGAVPIVLATIPLAAELPGATRLFDIVVVMTVVATVLTGPTLPWVARLLRVARRSEPRGIDIEAAPLDRIAADLLQVTISPVSRLHGVEVSELRLPPGASVSMVVRQGATLVPDERTVLRHGDDLLVVTPRRLREATERRLREVSAGGRLARWLGQPAR